MGLYEQHYLKHYGVKGQKWGVRRYQNEDGTLTALGKERYYTADEQKDLYEHAKKSTDAYEILGVDDIKQAGKLLKNQSNVVTSDYNEWGKSLRKDLSDMKNDPKFMSAVKDRVRDEWGDDVTDVEIPDYEVYSAVGEVFESHLSQRTKDAYKRFRDNADQYMKNAKDVANDIIGDLGDKPVSTFTSSSVVGRGLRAKEVNNTVTVPYRHAVENTLVTLSNYRWVNHLVNNEEYAWINSLEYKELRSAAVSEISKEWKVRG